MNFQAPNIGQKIGGYTNASGDLSPGLSGAFDYVDGAIGRIVGELRAQGLLDSTMIVLPAKHANAPVDPAARRAIDPLNYTTIINGVQAGLVGQVTADTVALIWLKDHSKTPQVLTALQANKAVLGAQTFYSGRQLARAFGGAFASSPNRRPDIIVQPEHGVVYTTATKLADHGGFTEEDIHVPLILSQPDLEVRNVDTPVDLRQVAPTILKTLGLRARDLDAVRREDTRKLPGIEHERHHGHGHDCDNDD
jgi:arylsulfatase A-like enzyme